MKRAVILLQIQAHEFINNELREPIPTDVMTSNGVPMKIILHIDGQDEEELCRKLRQFIESTKN